MDRNGQVRKEPTLADLEAFEKLLRDSLQAEPAKEPVLAAPAPANVPPPDIPVTDSADRNAMAELTRLIETPVEFDPPPLRGSAAPAPVETPQHDFEPATEHHLHGSAEAALAHDWKPPQTVEASFSPTPAPHPVAATPLDPLAAFEEELRRFDAIRATDHAAPAAHAAQEPVTPPATAAYPQTEYAPYHDTPRAETPIEGNWYQQAEQPQQPDYAAESRAESSLNAAEERLAAEAAAGAAAAGVTPGGGRSKGIFLALGGIAVAGLAVIGGSFMLGSGKKGGSAGDVPTIAAKTEPTKEKPADPGGMEIPNQNKQVLAARNTPETKPAAVVNTTEQPLDLNQVTKRDSVRVIAPNPFQPQPGTTPPQGDVAAPVAGGPGVEPRRVQSIRIPVGGGEPTPVQASAPTAGTAGAAGAAGLAAIAAGAAARPSTPVPAPPVAPPVAPRTDPSAGAAPTAKVESRPVTAQPRAETPKVAPPPKVATAPAATPAAPKATPPKTANAPLSLNPPKTTASGGGGFAIQLASRPTEADARSASTQLKAKFASTLGSRSPSVVSGEANGQTVYRVRVGGYSQADAVAACTKIKAAGGGCFVTKQ